MAEKRAQHSILEIFDLESGTRKTVAEFDTVIEAPNWTRDGKQLIYNGDGSLWYFDLETGKSTRIDTYEATTVNNDHVLSFDGSEIGVSSGTGGSWASKIFRYNLETGEMQPIVKKPLSFLHGWSADKKTMLYIGIRMHGLKHTVHVYSVDLSAGKLPYPEKQLTFEGANDGSEFAPSVEGKPDVIWYNSTASGTMQIWSMNADGSEKKQWTFDDSRNSWFPHISPDGKKVVYVSYRGEDLAPHEHVPDKWVQIRMLDLTEENPKEQVLFEMFGGQGTMNVNSWAPDSRQFAFVSYRK